MKGGLRAWLEAGLPTVPIDVDATWKSAAQDVGSDVPETQFRDHTHAFLPGLVENYVNKYELPIQRELTVLFVDIAGSTDTLLAQTPEEALAFVQRFMSIVTDAALTYCGDVKDYEGDGALLYFESVSEATLAALSIRDTLAQLEETEHRLRARLSLAVGPVVIGVIGTPLRRSVALIGPTINLAARLLKQIAPGEIIAIEAVIEHLRRDTPHLAQRFSLLDRRLELKGFEHQFVTAYSVGDTGRDLPD